MLEQTHNHELPAIPGKRYFTIGEVSELCAVKPHVLRYWEQEFPQLKPVKRRGNRRYYQRDDVLTIRQIRDLVEEHFPSARSADVDGVVTEVARERVANPFGSHHRRVVILRNPVREDHDGDLPGLALERVLDLAEDVMERRRAAVAVNVTEQA